MVISAGALMSPWPAQMSALPTNTVFGDATLISNHFEGGETLLKAYKNKQGSLLKKTSNKTRALSSKRSLLKKSPISG